MSRIRKLIVLGVGVVALLALPASIGPAELVPDGQGTLLDDTFPPPRCPPYCPPAN